MKVSALLSFVLLCAGLAGSAQAQIPPERDLCYGGLRVALLPALTRRGQTVPARLSITETPPQPAYNYESLVSYFAYPEGIEPVPGAVTLVPYPIGVFQSGSAGSRPYPDVPRLSWVMVSHGSSRQTQGPVLDLSFRAGADTPPGVYAVTALYTRIDFLNLECWSDLGRPDPATAPITVTGPGGKGDVDGDGMLTVADVVWTLQIALGMVQASPGVLDSADVADEINPGSCIGPDCERGPVGLVDVVRMLQILVGFDSLSG